MDGAYIHVVHCSAVASPICTTEDNASASRHVQDGAPVASSQWICRVSGLRDFRPSSHDHRMACSSHCLVYAVPRCHVMSASNGQDLPRFSPARLPCSRSSWRAPRPKRRRPGGCFPSGKALHQCRTRDPRRRPASLVCPVRRGTYTF
jgi:hypothetical protein